MSNADRSVPAVRLSKAELRAFLSALNRAPPPGAASRRKSRRHPLGGVDMTVEVHDTGPQVTDIPVKALNISQHGLGFLSATALLPGTRLSLSLPIGPDNGPVTKYALVRRCTVIRGAVHEIGVEFCQSWMVLRPG